MEVLTGRLIQGNFEACKEFLRGRSGHYVYILRRPDGRPFYVGKGTGDRVFSHENEARHPNDRLSNSHKLNVIRSIWRSGASLIYEIDFLHPLNEQAAYDREAELIAALKRLHEGGPLTNRHVGGGLVATRSPFTAERHTATLSGTPDDNPSRAILNEFVLGIAVMKSVVLKPLGQFKPRPSLRYPHKSMGASMRQAVALAAAASANGISLGDRCRIPRTVCIKGVDGFVENGVSCDILTSGMGTVIPASNGNASEEAYELTAAQAETVVGFLGETRCADLGIL